MIHADNVPVRFGESAENRRSDYSDLTEYTAEDARHPASVSFLRNDVSLFHGWGCTASRPCSLAKVPPTCLSKYTISPTRRFIKDPALRPASHHTYLCNVREIGSLRSLATWEVNTPGSRFFTTRKKGGRKGFVSRDVQCGSKNKNEIVPVSRAPLSPSLFSPMLCSPCYGCHEAVGSGACVDFRLNNTPWRMCCESENIFFVGKL